MDRNKNRYLFISCEKSKISLFSCCLFDLLFVYFLIFYFIVSLGKITQIWCDYMFLHEFARDYVNLREFRQICVSLCESERVYANMCEFKQKCASLRESARDYANLSEITLRYARPSRVWVSQSASQWGPYV